MAIICCTQKAWQDKLRSSQAHVKTATNFHPHPDLTHQVEFGVGRPGSQTWTLDATTCRSLATRADGLCTLNRAKGKQDQAHDGPRDVRHRAGIRGAWKEAEGGVAGRLGNIGVRSWLAEKVFHTLTSIWSSTHPHLPVRATVACEQIGCTGLCPPRHVSRLQRAMNGTALRPKPSEM